MVDLHSHVMYGWDDGAATIEDSMAMARMAAEDGTRILAATPHMWWAQTLVDPAMVRERVAEINAAIQEEGLDLTIVTGTEIPAWWDNLRPIQHKEALTLNDSRTVLFEAPFRQLPVNMPDLLFQLRMSGFTPLIAHPERCGPFIDDYDLYRRCIGEDVAIQITSGSLTGVFGERVQDLAWRMVVDERPIVIASDAHGTGKRRPVMSAARAMLAEHFGEEAADLMCRANAAALIENKPPRVANFPRKADDGDHEGQRGLAARLQRAFSRSRED